LLVGLVDEKGWTLYNGSILNLKYIDMSDKEQILAQFREEIDSIDMEILGLLKKRIGVVRKVGEWKHAQGTKDTIIRPGREAKMVRKVAARDDIGLPPAALAQMWRTIIGGAINVEENAKVAVMDCAGVRECYWLAREYFGGFTKTSKHEGAHVTLKEVAEGDATVGVVPLWDMAAGTPWWLDLAETSPDLKVFARLPFIKFGGSRLVPVVALARVKPENSGDDRSLWVFKTPEHKGVDVIEPWFEKAELASYVQAVHRSGGYNHFLLELDGFVTPDDARVVTALENMRDDVTSVNYIGAYAKPIDFEYKKKE
jgi:chorismate mutase/prephenate dehydratase